MSINQNGCSRCGAREGFEADYSISNLTACTPCSDINCLQCEANCFLCTQCGPNYIATINNNTCIAYSTLGCLTTNSTGCATCNAGNGVQIDFSGTGLGGCVPCQDMNCAQCSVNYQACTGCRANYFLDVLNNTCLSAVSLGCVTTNSSGCATCLAGQGALTNFQGTGLLGCVPCSDIHCGSCSTNAQYCSVCQSGYFRNVQNGLCLSPSDIGCLTTNATGCETCPDGRGVQTNYQNMGINGCAPCNDANCHVCSQNYLMCSACNPETFLTQLNNTCLTPENLNCQTINETGCLTCSPGLGVTPNYQNTGVYGCVACSIPHCADCSNDFSSCRACQSDYFLTSDSKTCISSAALNCLTTNQTGCASCNPGQGVQANYQATGLYGCIACNDTNCVNCNMNYMVCVACSLNYLLNTVNNTCVSSTVLNCSSVNATGCASCGKGQGLQSNIAGTSLIGCADCMDPNCDTCSLDYQFCTKCTDSYFLDTVDNVCISKETLGCNATNATGCATCMIGEGVQPNFLNTSLFGCVACNDLHCGNCSTNYAVCDKCQGNYFLNALNGVCLSSSDLSCNTTNATGCETCPQGNGVIANINSTGIFGCVPCKEANCGDCSVNYEVCNGCEVGYFFDEINRVCLSPQILGCLTVNSSGCATCNEGSGPAAGYLSSSLIGCAPCQIDSCASCNDNILECDRCIDGYFRPLVDNTTRGSLIDNTVCQAGTIFNCETLRDGVGCDSCVMGTGLNFNFANTAYQACAPCQENCVDCRDNSISCMTCQSDFISFSVNGNLTDCYSCQNLSCPANACFDREGCQICEAGEYLTGVAGLDLSQCLDCPDGCTVCASNTNCTGCEPDYTLTTTRINMTTMQICMSNGAERLAMGLLALMTILLMLL